MARTREDILAEDAMLRAIARDPGDYYDTKAADARTLREALLLAESRGDTAGATRIREALERSLYVGD